MDDGGVQWTRTEHSSCRAEEAEQKQTQRGDCWGWYGLGRWQCGSMQPSRKQQRGGWPQHKGYVAFCCRRSRGSMERIPDSSCFLHGNAHGQCTRKEKKRLFHTIISCSHACISLTHPAPAAAALGNGRLHSRRPPCSHQLVASSRSIRPGRSSEAAGTAHAEVLLEARERRVMLMHAPMPEPQDSFAGFWLG